MGLLEEQSKVIDKKIDELTSEYNEEINNKYYYTDDEKEEFAKEKRKKELEASKKELFTFLDKHPEIAEEIVERYTKKEVKENNKRNAKLRKFAPMIIGISVIGGIITGSLAKKFEINHDNIVIPTSYEKTYSTIDEAPIELVEAYVNHEMDLYADEIEKGNIKRNEDFENVFRDFQKNVSEGNTNRAMEDAINLNNYTINDMIDSTMPFDRTVYSGGYINEHGEVVLPVTSLDNIENSELLYDGGLKKKGR